ncbi:MAG: CBS domain-containing protein [Candidatus Hermodarchaeota archaeon]
MTEAEKTVWSERETEPFPQLDLLATASKAMRLIESGFHSIIITEEDGRTYEGIIKEFDLLRRRVNPKIAMKTIRKNVPPLKKDKSLREAAHIVLASGYTRLPIVDEHYKVVGSISDRNILFGLIDDEFQNIEAKELCNEVPRIYLGETCSKLLSLMRDENISHVPVFDNEEKIAGLITSHELVTQFLQPLKKSSGTEDRVELKLGVPIDTLVREPITVAANTPLRDVITLMKDQKIPAVLVVSDEDTAVYCGIITIRDLLRRYTASIEESDLDYHIRVSGEPDPDVKNISFRKSLRLLERYTPFLGDTGSINIRFRKIEYQSKRGMFQYECSARLSSNRGYRFSVSAIDFGATNALNTCINRLTRVIESKRSLITERRTKGEKRTDRRRLRGAI